MISIKKKRSAIFAMTLKTPKMCKSQIKFSNFTKKQKTQEKKNEKDANHWKLVKSVKNHVECIL